MCVNFRALNACILPEILLVPTYTVIADTLSYAKPKVYSSLDLRNSFHNFKIVETSTKYIGFQTHLGPFEYLKAFFGVQSVNFF